MNDYWHRYSVSSTDDNGDISKDYLNEFF